jgi:hypothetical protein
MKHFEYVILLLVAIQATSFARYLLIDVESEGDGKKNIYSSIFK